MKLVYTSIIIGSIIISFAIFYSVTYEERAKMKYCVEDLKKYATENRFNAKLLIEEIKSTCESKIYGKWKIDCI